MASDSWIPTACEGTTNKEKVEHDKKCTGQDTERKGGQCDGQLELMDEEEFLELVEFDPMVESDKTWEASEIIIKWNHHHFSKYLTDESEVNNIMADFLIMDSKSWKRKSRDWSSRQGKTLTLGQKKPCTKSRIRYSA